MSGICGLASRSGAPDRGRLAAMSATLVHRGPDGEGLLVDGPVGLAARRLATGGEQPLTNEDGTVAVVRDGALLNSSELRRQLERSGHRFRTHGDAEVVAHLYEEHGDGFAALLRGMFAVAVWDTRRRRLVLARDRFGIKPLVYRAGAAGLAFASDTRALPRGEIDLDALEAFLAFGAVPAPLTIFRDVRKLAPGHLLVWEEADGLHRLERFARPAPVPVDEMRTEDTAELTEELRARLRDSVRAHLASDVPVGVLLSGGVDSAVLTALAAQESDGTLRTFSVGLSDELADARGVAERYGTVHRELSLGPDAALLPALAAAFDEPFADPSALPTLLVSELAARDVKVALAGEGGRALFGGDRVGGLARLVRASSDNGRKELFGADARAELTGRRSAFDPVGTSLVGDLLVKTDRASMAHSLETRVPFLDTVVTNLALALPTRRSQALLRKAAAPLVPRGSWRTRSIPAAAWLRGELEPFARATLSAETLRRQGFFRPDVVTRLLDEHAARRTDHGRRLWSLLAFTLWHEHHVEGAAAEAPLEALVVEP